ncbi:MAG: META domain-containing protein [Terricaulis sp.]|nr:META domain-containing protein [Terricaulis sp.]
MSELSGPEWRRIDDEEANPHPPTITFEDGRASGYAGCNRWFANVTRAGDALSFGQAGATRMACAESSMAAEQRFFAVIDATRAARIVGEELILTDESGAELARFRR